MPGGAAYRFGLMLIPVSWKSAGQDGLQRYHAFFTRCRDVVAVNVVEPQQPLTLGDIATDRISPWMGAIGVFVVAHAKAAASRLPLNVLVPTIDLTTSPMAGWNPKHFSIKTFPDVQPSAEVMTHMNAT